MLNENQEKIIKEKFNKYMDNIEIPKNLEEVIMKSMNNIEKVETNDNQINKKVFNIKKFISVAAAVVIVAGVTGFTTLKMGWIGDKQNNNVIAESQSESGKNIPLASNDKIKSLYDIEEYTSNLTDSANGKLAFLKLLENNELQTEQKDDYYRYTDPFGKVYNIKEITNVTSEEGLMGNDNWAALFKVTVEYIDNNNETNTMELAVILLPNHEVQNKGTYLNYTGTTSFVTGFTDLYTEESSENVVKNYTNNLTDSTNGKLAFSKILESNELKTEQHDGYYTYIDPFENKYNIKEVTKVTSEEGLMGNDNWAALFKVTAEYMDNNNQTNTMELAIILLPNHEVQNRGTYVNFTGTTSFVRGFTDLYTEEASENVVQNYTNNLIDSTNGKIAFSKILESNELKTEQHDGYYTYIDPFKNKYNIKEITKVTSEEGLMGNDNWAALFKVTVEYLDNNNQTKTMELAIILLPNYEVQNRGTYVNFTGTTSFVRGFTDLYNEESAEIEKANVVTKEEYVKVWETDPADTEIQLYENGVFVTDHYTKSSEIKGNYKVQGNIIELTTEDGRKWEGNFLTESRGLTLNIKMDGEELKFYDM